MIKGWHYGFVDPSCHGYHKLYDGKIVNRFYIIIALVAYTFSKKIWDKPFPSISDAYSILCD